MFSCKFCEISKNTLSHRTPPLAASVVLNILPKQRYFFIIPSPFFLTLHYVLLDVSVNEN